MHTSNEMIWLHNDELNGFPKLYSITNVDKRLLDKFKKSIEKLSSDKQQIIL